MIAATHAAFATGLYLGGSALFEYLAEPIGWGLAVFFSLVPDIDLPTSRIGRPLFWLSVRLHYARPADLAAYLRLVAIRGEIIIQAWGGAGRCWHPCCWKRGR